MVLWNRRARIQATCIERWNDFEALMNQIESSPTPPECHRFVFVFIFLDF